MSQTTGVGEEALLEAVCMNTLTLGQVSHKSHNRYYPVKPDHGIVACAPLAALASTKMSHTIYHSMKAKF